MPLKSKDPPNKDPHPQDGPFFIVDHGGDLPSKENVDEWCEKAESTQPKFVHTRLTKSDDILALAKRFDGWDNVIFYSVEPVIFYDIDYKRLAFLQYSHVDEPTSINAAAKAWVPGEYDEVSVGPDGMVDEKALIGAFRAWRLEENEKEKLRLGWAIAKDPVHCREEAGMEGEMGKLWEALKTLRRPRVKVSRKLNLSDKLYLEASFAR